MQAQGVARNVVSTPDHDQDEYELVPIAPIVSCFRYRVIKRALVYCVRKFFLDSFISFIVNHWINGQVDFPRAHLLPLERGRAWRKTLPGLQIQDYGPKCR